MVERIQEQGSIKVLQNAENPRGIAVTVPNELIPGIEYGIKGLKNSGLAEIEAEKGKSDEETTQFFLTPTKKTPQQEENTRWLARLFDKTKRPAEELKTDLDEGLKEKSSDNLYVRRLRHSF